MPIAILSKPADDSINSVYRPIVYEVEVPDTSGTLELVRASVKLYINGSVVNNNNPIIQDPDLTQTGGTADHTQFTFDISGVARNYITSDLQILGGEGSVDATNSMKTLYIQVGGIYKSTTTNELSEASVASFSGNECYIFNGVYQHIDTQGFTAYELGGYTKKFLTNFPRSGVELYSRVGRIKVKTDESYFLSLIDTSLSADTLIKVDTWDSSDSIVDNYRIDASSSNVRHDLGVGCSNFANLVSGDMHSSNTGTLPIITASIAYYDILFFDATSIGNLSEYITFEIDRKSHDYSTRFHWLNRLGGFDSWTFDGASSRGQNQSKALYEQNLDYSFNIYDSETGINAIESKNTFSSYSGLLNNDKRKWLEELYTSPEVYVVEDGAYVPILITDSQVKTIDDDKKLIQVKINYTYSHQNVINV